MAAPKRKNLQNEEKAKIKVSVMFTIQSTGFCVWCTVEGVLEEPSSAFLNMIMELTGFVGAVMENTHLQLLLDKRVNEEKRRWYRIHSDLQLQHVTFILTSVQIL